MYIPKLHSFSPEKAENILALANKSLISQRKTIESPEPDGSATEAQFEEVRFVVSRELLGEYRASLEMDIFEEVDSFLAIDGVPTTPAELSAFWSQITPKVITPVLEEIARLNGEKGESVDVTQFQPWTPEGLREMCVRLASKLRTAQLDNLDNDQFVKITELDVSRIALIGTTKWVGSLPVGDILPDEGEVPPPPPPTLDSVATEKAGRGRPKGTHADDPDAQEVISGIWKGFLASLDFDVNGTARELGISPPTLRNYGSGKKARLSASQAAIIKRECEKRVSSLQTVLKLLKQANV